ncbi:cytochrome P450 4C1-like [Ctenocephalides felis]|nr:cytochrome P450 4C1-like [Ctenocephalides felis]
MADVALNNICETAMGTNLKAVIDSDSIDYKCSIFRWSQLFVYRLQRYWLHPAVIYNLTPMGYQMRKVLKNLHSFTKGIITDRKKKLMTNVSLNAKTSDDEDKDEFHVKKRMAMLDLLLSAEARGENIDENGIHEEVDTFTFEGHDTTSMGLIFTLLSLADNPDVQRKAYEEIAEVFGEDEMPATIQDLQKLTYLDRCIKETLRLYPSVPFISRDLTEPLDLVDCRIPAGQIINVHIFDLHRDPDIYPNPEMFDPDRFLPEECAKRHPFAYIPFSAGPRNCIGQKFAMLELKSVVSTILRHYTLEAITKPKDLIFVIDIILRTDHPIKIKFRKRRPL